MAAVNQYFSDRGGNIAYYVRVLCCHQLLDNTEFQNVHFHALHVGKYSPSSTSTSEENC